MPFAEVGNIYLLTFLGQYAEQRIMFTQTYRISAVGPVVTDGLAAITLIKGVRAGAGGLDLLESKYLALLPETYQLDTIRAQQIAPNRFVMHDVTRLAAGTHPEACDTANLAATITLRTDWAGRDQVGVKHIGPIPTTDVVTQQGEISAAYTVKLNTFGTALLNSYSDLATELTFDPVIYHPIESVPPLYDKVTSYTLGTTTRVMRRRTVRVGV